MPGETQTYSSFGPTNTTTGGSRPAFVARTFLQSQRYLELDRKQQWYDCTQHNAKRFDFDGRIINVNAGTTQPLLSVEQAHFYVPLRSRQPSSPYRLGRSIVDAFTNLLFGEERWPSFLVAGDANAQDFVEALSEAAELQTKFIMARNLGGSVGSVGMSWCYRNGLPCVEVHNTKHLFVHEWDDRRLLVPAHVTECYQYLQDEWSAEKQGFVRQAYWYRHDWLKDVELAYKPVKVTRDNKEPDWSQHVDDVNSTEHGDGIAHFVWVQNLPSTDIDGMPDYHGLYDEMDAIDVLNSVLHKATTLNLDPTVVLMMDADIVKRMGVKKGSDNAIAVGEGGDAKYMEISGQGIDVGIKLFEVRRRTALETAQCVIPDPHEIAASGTSSLAMKVIYRPMMARGSVHRNQYGNALKTILTQQLLVARARKGQRVPVKTDDKDAPGGAGETGDVVQVFNLPPKIEVADAVDPETGMATGEKTETPVERDPGTGGTVALRWPDWFPLTPADKAQLATTLSTAVGAKPIMSPQSASEELAVAFGRDPNEEWKRMQAQQKVDDAKEQAQLDAMNTGEDAGGKVGSKDELPPGAKPGGDKPGKDPGPKDGDLDVDLDG